MIPRSLLEDEYLQESLVLVVALKWAANQAKRKETTLATGLARARHMIWIAQPA